MLHQNRTMSGHRLIRRSSISRVNATAPPFRERSKSLFTPSGSSLNDTLGDDSTQKRLRALSLHAYIERTGGSNGLCDELENPLFKNHASKVYFVAGVLVTVAVAIAVYSFLKCDPPIKEVK